jgi:hypothetical protein
VNADLPDAFVRLRDLVQIHLKQIAKIPKKRPIHAAALLVVVACEALSKLLDRKDYDIFAHEYLGKRDVPSGIGRALFKALRHGLAHVYTPYPIYVGRDEVWPILVWTADAGRHLQIAKSTLVGGHSEIRPIEEGDSSPVRLVLIVECLIADLDSLFRDLEAQLLTSASMRATVNRNARTFRQNKAPRPSGHELAAWRTFVSDRQWRWPAEEHE